MKQNLWIILLLTILKPNLVRADKIYSCKEDMSAELSVDLFDGLKGHLKEVPKSPRTLTFVAGQQKAIVKNVTSEQFELKELAPNVYYDYSHPDGGLWKIVPGSGSNHTYIFYQAIVASPGPMASEFAYICQ